MSASGPSPLPTYDCFRQGRKAQLGCSCTRCRLIWVTETQRVAGREIPTRLSPMFPSYHMISANAQRELNAVVVRSSNVLAASVPSILRDGSFVPLEERSQQYRLGPKAARG